MPANVPHGSVILGEDIDGIEVGEAKTWKGGKAMWLIEAGTFLGTNKLQIQTPRGTWLDVASATMTSDGTMVVDLPPGKVRFEHITNAPTDLFTYLIHIPT